MDYFRRRNDNNQPVQRRNYLHPAGADGPITNPTDFENSAHWATPGPTRHSLSPFGTRDEVEEIHHTYVEKNLRADKTMIGLQNNN